MLSRLGSDRRGVAAVEFALIAPIMIVLYMGLAELSLAMMAERRAAHSASIVADLVAQSSQMDGAQMTDIFNVGNAILKPFPTTPLKIRVTSVTADALGVARVTWSQGHGLGALGSGTAVAGVPAGLLLPGDSIIMADVQYAFSSPLHHTIPSGLLFSETFFLRPRKSPSVVWTGP